MATRVPCTSWLPRRARALAALADSEADSVLPATSATVAFICAMAVATWAISCCWLWIPLGRLLGDGAHLLDGRAQLGHGGGDLLDEPAQVVPTS